MSKLREEISKILVKWSMPTRQASISELVSLFAEFGEEILEESRPRKKAKKSFSVQCNKCPRKVKHPHIEIIKYTQPYVSNEDRAFNEGINIFESNMRQKFKALLGEGGE